MARKMREYPTEFTAFWDVWSGRNAGADKTRSADIWDAAALNDETIRRIMSAAGSVPPDAVPMAWLRAAVKETPENISGDAATEGQSSAAEAEAERETPDAPIKEKTEAKGIQTSENIPAEQPAQPAPTDVQDEKRASPPAEPNDAIRQTDQTNTTPEIATRRKRGRPKKEVPTVAVMLHIRPETRAWLKMESARTDTPMSEIIDALVSARTRA